MGQGETATRILKTLESGRGLASAASTAAAGEGDGTRVARVATERRTRDEGGTT